MESHSNSCRRRLQSYLESVELIDAVAAATLASPFGHAVPCCDKQGLCAESTRCREGATNDARSAIQETAVGRLIIRNSAGATRVAGVDV